MSDKNDIGSSNFRSYLDSITPENFESTCMEIFHFQYLQNTVYQNYINLLGRDSKSVQSPVEIPFLPVELFKQHSIKTGTWKENEHFVSSGTTGRLQSRHAVRFPENYLYAAGKTFERFFGPPSQYEILALLPSYSDRKGSSLIRMVEHFMSSGNQPYSGFFLHEYEKLHESYEKAHAKGRKVMIWGVSFALLDMAEKSNGSFEDAIIIETGGMKGRRKEITREELHAILKEKLRCRHICSEYGMTELFSQAYSMSDGIFSVPPWMKVFSREIGDPLSLVGNNITGAINIIDLSNIDTCSFIATQDIGKTYKNSTFEISGRLDNSDIRGCNLMIN